jgi:hypothetical protein
MSDLLEEANLDYSEQRRLYLFKKSLPYIILASLLFVLILSYVKWSGAKDKETREQKTDLLLEYFLSDDKNKSLKMEILNTLSNDEGGIADIAKFTSFQESKSLDVLDDIISSSKKLISINLAKNIYVSILLDKKDLSEQDETSLKNFISSIDKSQPLYYNSRVLSALYHIKKSDLDSAKKDVDLIIDSENVTDHVRIQAEAINNYISSR